MKKLTKLLSVFVIAGALAGAGAVAGCTNNTDNHSHSYVYTDKDNLNHTKSCSDCDEVNVTESHRYTDATDTTCNDCGHVRTISGGEETVNSITLNKNSTTIKVGETETLTATVDPTTATVTWESSDTTVATVANGVVTAVAEGTATITAKAGNETATCEVTVEAATQGGEEETVNSITLNKNSTTIKVGETETLTATVDPTTATVTWESSDTTVATVAGGVVTAVKAGTATITAKAGNETATCEVTVEAASQGGVEYDLVPTDVDFDAVAREIDPSASGQWVLPETYTYKGKVTFTATGKSRFEVGNNRFNTQGASGTIIITLSGVTNSLTIEGTNASGEGTMVGLLLTKDGETVVEKPAVESSAAFDKIELTDLPAGTYVLSSVGGSARITKISLLEKLEKSAATGISVTALSLDFLKGEDFSTNGLTVTLNYANGRQDALSAADYTVDSEAYNKNAAGKYTITVKYKDNPEFTATYSVYVYTIDEIELYTIGLNGNTQVTVQQAVLKGETLSSQYLTVKGTGTVGTGESARTHVFNLPASALDIALPSTTSVGEQTVSVSLKGDYTTDGEALTETYKVVVLDAVRAIDGVVTIEVGANKDVKTLTQAVQFLKLCKLDASVEKVIKLEKGTYTEKVWIDMDKVTLIGGGANADETVITYSLVEGDKEAINDNVWGLNCATVHVVGKNFKVYNVAIRNDFDYIANSGKYSGNQAAQGVALTLDGDGAVIYNSHLFGNQDTLYLKSGRSYYYKSQIDGNVDFIFGNNDGLAFFEECEIKAISRAATPKGTNQNGYVTAAKHEEASKPDYGYIFYKCKLTDDGKVADGAMSLGRPWGAKATVAYIECSFSAAYSQKASNDSDTTIKTHRWDAMSGNDPAGADFAEYGSTDAAGNPIMQTAVTGGKVLTADQAANYTKANIFGTGNGEQTYSTAFDWQTEYTKLRILAGLEEGELPEDTTISISFKDATLPNGNCVAAINEKYADKLTWTGAGSFEVAKPENGVKVGADTVITMKIAGEVTVEAGYYFPAADYEITYKNGIATIKMVAITGQYGNYIGGIVIDTSKKMPDTDTQKPTDPSDPSNPSTPATKKEATITVVDSEGVVEGDSDVTVEFSADGTTAGKSDNPSDFKMTGNASTVTVTIANLKAGDKISLNVYGFTGSTGNASGVKISSVNNATAAAANPAELTLPSTSTVNEQVSGTFEFTVTADGTVSIVLVRSVSKTARITKIEVGAIGTSGGSSTTPAAKKEATITVADSEGVVEGDSDVTVEFSADGTTAGKSDNPSDFKMTGNASTVTVTIANLKAGQKISLNVYGFTGSTGNASGVKISSVNNATAAATNPAELTLPSTSTVKEQVNGTFVFTVTADGTVSIVLVRSVSKTARITKIEVVAGGEDESNPSNPSTPSTGVKKEATITVSGNQGVVSGSSDVGVAFVDKDGNTQSGNSSDFKIDGADSAITVTIANLTAGQKVSLTITGYTGSTGNPAGVIISNVTNATASSANAESLDFSSDNKVRASGTFEFTVDEDGTVTIVITRSTDKTARVTEIKVVAQ